MSSLRKRKAAIAAALLLRNAQASLEDRLWDQMTPVGRECGSPDFDRLIEQDFRNGVGIFDPALQPADFDGARVKAELLETLGQLIEQSGGSSDGFALSAWLDAWLEEPLPQLKGATPAQVLRTLDGQQQVVTLLERMRGGLVA